MRQTAYGTTTRDFADRNRLPSQENRYPFEISRA